MPGTIVSGVLAFSSIYHLRHAEIAHLCPTPWPDHKHVVAGEVPVDDLEEVKVGKG